MLSYPMKSVLTQSSSRYTSIAFGFDDIDGRFDDQSERRRGVPPFLRGDGLPQIAVGSRANFRFRLCIAVLDGVYLANLDRGQDFRLQTQAHNLMT